MDPERIVAVRGQVEQLMIEASQAQLTDVSVAIECAWESLVVAVAYAKDHQAGSSGEGKGSATANASRT